MPDFSARERCQCYIARGGCLRGTFITRLQSGCGITALSAWAGCFARFHLRNEMCKGSPEVDGKVHPIKHPQKRTMSSPATTLLPSGRSCGSRRSGRWAANQAACRWALLRAMSRHGGVWSATAVAVDSSYQQAACTATRLPDHLTTRSCDIMHDRGTSLRTSSPDCGSSAAEIRLFRAPLR